MLRDPDRRAFDVADDPGPDHNARSHLERAHEEIDMDRDLMRRQEMADLLRDVRAER